MLPIALQPENLLLDARGRVKLSDFGWAVHATPPHHEKQNTMCGTPEYVAPEMLLKEPEYTKAVDTWSLGVLNYELLTGVYRLRSVRLSCENLPVIREGRWGGGGCCEIIPGFWRGWCQKFPSTSRG